MFLVRKQGTFFCEESRRRDSVSRKRGEYEEEIVEKAEASAEAFLEEGVWKRLKQKEAGKSEE